MSEAEKIKLYGDKSCHKTHYYIDFLRETGLPFSFYDIKKDKEKELELSSLYSSGKANFPTLLIGHKKLRNPSDEELSKWLSRIEPANYKDLAKPAHNSEKFNFTCGINKAEGDCSDAIGY